jgi:quinol monooxygenase YgiN
VTGITFQGEGLRLTRRSHLNLISRRLVDRCRRLPLFVETGGFVARFTQQTRLLAKKGRALELLEKFLEAAEIQQANSACEVMLAGIAVSEPDAVYVFEVWSGEAEWEQARASDAITAWSKDMPALVAEWPNSVQLHSVGGKGI